MASSVGGTAIEDLTFEIGQKHIDGWKPLNKTNFRTQYNRFYMMLETSYTHEACWLTYEWFVHDRFQYLFNLTTGL